MLDLTVRGAQEKLRRRHGIIGDPSMAGGDWCSMANAGTTFLVHPDRNKQHENEVHVLADSMGRKPTAGNASEHGSHSGAMVGGSELYATSF